MHHVVFWLRHMIQFERWICTYQKDLQLHFALQEQQLRPAGIWMHCTWNTSAETFDRLFKFKRYTHKKSCRSFRFLLIVEELTSLDGSNLHMISWTAWQRTAVQEPRNSEIRKTMWISLPAIACGAKARICHSCWVSRPWWSEKALVKATVNSGQQFQCRAEGLVAASVLLLWRCVRGLCFAVPPAVFAVEIWVWNQRSTRAPRSLFTFCLLWGSLAVTSFELSLKGWDLAAFSKPRGNHISFNELLEITLMHWGRTKVIVQLLSLVAATNRGSCSGFCSIQGWARTLFDFSLVEDWQCWWVLQILKIASFPFSTLQVRWELRTYPTLKSHIYSKESLT